MIAGVPNFIRHPDGKNRFMLGARVKLVLQIHPQIAETAYGSIALCAEALILFIHFYPDVRQDAFGVSDIK